MYFLPSTSFQVIDDNFTSVVAQQKPLQPNNAPQGMVMVNPPPQAAPNQTAIPQLEVAELQESPYTIEELAADPAFSSAALCFYQADRMVILETQNPNKSQQELVTMAIHEWHSKLTTSQKAKYLRIAERMGLTSVCRAPPGTHGQGNLLSMSSYVNSGPPPPYGAGPMCLEEMLKREPKKPPKNGYSLFTSEQLAKYVNVEPQKRLAEVARIWRENISQEEKEQYDARNKVLLAQYQRQLGNFIDTLTPEERYIYEDYCRKRNKYKHHKKKYKGDDGLEPKKKSKKKKDTVQQQVLHQ